MATDRGKTGKSRPHVLVVTSRAEERARRPLEKGHPAAPKRVVIRSAADHRARTNTAPAVEEAAARPKNKKKTTKPRRHPRRR